MRPWWNSLPNRDGWGQINRDATAIEGREKPVAKARPPKPVPRKKGRPRRGEVREPQPETRLQRQVRQAAAEALAELPVHCDVGTKKNSKGYKETWVGYKLHADVSDCCLPISVALTAASVSASNRLEWSGSTDRTLGIGSDNFFGEIKLIALKDQNPAQERRSQSSQEAQDLQGLKGSHDTR